ncbi:hypothetical protein SAMN04487979_13623 [Flavobacterium sp. ov086]|nr:hypothetical protein SAMN04487979_13623 [Flavobacterium sp. ov086]
MLQFYDIGFIYKAKYYHKKSLLKTAFIAFIRAFFSKKTTQTLVFTEKMP